jgi:hypothetical protein
MRSRTALGAVVFLAGLLLLYLLRGALVGLIVLVLSFVGIVIAFVLIALGLGMIFSSGRSWTIRW